METIIVVNAEIELTITHVYKRKIALSISDERDKAVRRVEVPADELLQAIKAHYTLAMKD